MEVVIFEDDLWPDFQPLSSTRHLAQQVLGTRTLVQSFAEKLGSAPSLTGREYLAATARHATGLSYNEAVDGRVLAINARTNPLVDVTKLAERRGGVALVEGSDVAIAVLSKEEFGRALAADRTVPQRALRSASRRLERLEAERATLFRYPWDLLEANEGALRADLAGGGIDPGAEVEEFVSFDPSSGPVVVGEGARIESFSRLSGPCYVGPRTVVHSALVRPGTSMGEDCRVGGEVDHSIIYAHTNKAHSGYLGHSLVGEWVNVGAGATTSDLKSTYGPVRVARPSGRVETGLTKLGAMIGDMAKLSIGTMVYAGKALGVSAQASGLVDRDVPDFTRYDGYREESLGLDLPSVVKTAERMMERRGLRLGRSGRALIETLYGRSKG